MGVMDRLRGEQTPRVAVIGLDGVPFSLLADNADRLEHVDALLETGSAGPMSSPIPPDSSATWPCLTTGVNPGQTGVYGLIDRELTGYETYVTAADDVQAGRLWDHVRAAERPATVLNVPVTYPPQRNLQRMVAGFLAPDIERAVYPRELIRDLESMEYRLDVDATVGADDPDALLEEAYDTLDARYDTLAHFIERDDWDLFMGVFMAPDRVNHFLYGEYLRGGDRREDFLSFYEQLDTYLGAIRSRLPDDVTLVVVSEHGFARLEYEVQLNEWLERTGWASFGDDPDSLSDITDESRAYALPGGRLYLNLHDREPRGPVDPTEYEVVRDRLREAVLDLTGPDGRPVADRVERREDCYRGDHVDMAPDLVVVPNEGFDLKGRISDADGVFHDTHRTGMHQDGDAALLVDEPDLDLDGADVYDVSPTVLALLGLDVDLAEFDGVSRL